MNFPSSTITAVIAVVEAVNPKKAAFNESGLEAMEGDVAAALIM